MTPLSWWVTCAFRDDRESFYVKAALEAERMRRADTRPTAYVLPIDRADYWKKAQPAAYHEEVA